MPWWLRWLFVGAFVACAALIACNTKNGGAPDEGMHVDACRFFQTHWRPPAMGSDEVLYSGMGWSRVYTGEIVYLIFGRIGGLVAHVITLPHDPYLLYRLLNVLLLGLTLAYLMETHCGWFDPRLLALLIAGIPQAVYIYGYANSDGWGLSANVFLFLVTAQLVEIPPERWRWPHLLGWHAALLAVLLSKTPFLLGLVLPSAMLIAAFGEGFVRRPRKTLLYFALGVILPAALVYALAALYSPNLSPFAHDQFQAQELAMREAKAWPDHRPSNPAWGMNLVSKGYTYDWLLSDSQWTRQNFQSAYAQFGGWTAVHPVWVYQTALWIGGLGVAVTLAGLIAYYRGLSRFSVVCLLAGPPVMLINFVGDIWHSMHIDFQPQGRYLFPCIIPLFFWFAGTVTVEGRWSRRFHLFLVLALLALSIYNLLGIGAFNPDLR